MILLFNDEKTKTMACYRFAGELERLTLMQQGSTRPKDWTHVVNCSGHRRLLYNFDEGRAEYYDVRDGLPRRLLHYTRLPRGWTHILQEGMVEEKALPILFCYKRDTGAASFYVINVDDDTDLRTSAPPDNSFALLTNVTLLPGWTHVLPFDLMLILPAPPRHHNGLFFYNSENGLARIYGYDDAGCIQEIFCTTLSTGWTHVTPIDTLAHSLPLLLFYNNRSGDAAFYEISKRCMVKEVSCDRWESGWTQIVFGSFLRDQGGDVNSALLFYNGSSGVTQLSHIDDPTSINQISRTILAPGWTQVIWLIDTS